jgi:hypothetical protein
MEYEVYFQIFVALGVLHITIDLIRCVVSMCEVADMPASIDERLDIIEEHIVQLMEGERVSNHKNTIIYETESIPTHVEKED